MNKITTYFTIILIILLSLVSIKSVKAADRTVAYFKEYYCIECQGFIGYPDGYSNAYHPETDYVKIMEDQGITVLIYDIQKDDGANDLFTAYNKTYGNDNSNPTVPILFFGTQFIEGADDLIVAINNNTIYNESVTPLLDVNVTEGGAFSDLRGFAGFMAVLGAGLLDGVNPCAIAMLLLFVSLLGFTDNKKSLILVSITYISALFFSYLLIGFGLLNVLNNYTDQASIINTIINWVIFILVSFLFLLNLYDFFVSRKQDYSKVKNQLPKWVQKYNKLIVKKFTYAMNNKENKKGLISILILTFILGLTLSVTELICTGQIYVTIVNEIKYESVGYSYFLLLSYNIMFIIPLVIIAVVSITSNGIMSTSNFIREHLHIIKILNALLFLIIAVIFYFRIF